MKTIVLSHPAAKQLDALPADIREQITDALHLYAVKAEGDIKKLKNLEGFRLRTGRYRVIFDQTAETVLVLYVGKRETTTYH